MFKTFDMLLLNQTDMTWVHVITQEKIGTLTNMSIGPSFVGLSFGPIFNVMFPDEF